MSKKINKAIIKATKETFDAVIGHPIRSSTLLDRRVNGRNLDTSVIITVAGKLSGTIAMRCSKEIGAQLASNMMGVDIVPGSEDMKDAIGELLNMIIGASTSYMRFFYSECKLSTPTTLVGEDTDLDVQEIQAPEIAHIPFSYEGNELCMDVMLH